jgi:hypothetical protein
VAWGFDSSTSGSPNLGFVYFGHAQFYLIRILEIRHIDTGAQTPKCDSEYKLLNPSESGTSQHSEIGDSRPHILQLALGDKPVRVGIDKLERALNRPHLIANRRRFGAHVGRADWTGKCLLHREETSCLVEFLGLECRDSEGY